MLVINFFNKYFFFVFFFRLELNNPVGTNPEDPITSLKQNHHNGNPSGASETAGLENHPLKVSHRYSFSADQADPGIPRVLSRRLTRRLGAFALSGLDFRLFPHNRQHFQHGGPKSNQQSQGRT